MGGVIITNPAKPSLVRLTARPALAGTRRYCLRRMSGEQAWVADDAALLPRAYSRAAAGRQMTIDVESLILLLRCRSYAWRRGGDLVI